MPDRVPRPFEARILRVYGIYLRDSMAEDPEAGCDAELSGTTPMALDAQKSGSMFILESIQTIDLQ